MISEQAYALCMAIEELPASEMQTQISVMAAELRAKVAGVEEENVRLRPRAEIAGSLLTRTSKAEKRCRELEEELTLCLKEAPVGILAAICDMNKILGLEMPKTSYTEIPPAIQAVVARAEAAEARVEKLEWLVEVQEFYMYRLRNPGGWSTPGMERAKIGVAWQRRSAANDELRAMYIAATEVKP